MLECFKSKKTQGSLKTGKSVYYYDGKKISKADAQKIANTEGKKLPKCVSKTQKNILSSLKKRLKQTYTHREQYKATSKDLEERLNACDIIRQEYNRLLELLNSAGDTVDVLNRVCLTQDLKQLMDDEYKRMEKNIRDSYNKIDDLEANKASSTESINILNNSLLEASENFNRIIQTLSDEKNLRRQVETNLQRVTEECSDKPQLLVDIEALRNANADISATNNSISIQLEQSQNNIDELNGVISGLRERVVEFNSIEERLRNAERIIEENRVRFDRYENEVKTLEDENKALRDSVIGKGDLETILNQLRTEMDFRIKQEDALRDEIIKLNDDCKSQIDTLQNDKQDLSLSLTRESDRYEYANNASIQEIGKLTSKLKEYEEKYADLKKLFDSIDKERSECKVQTQSITKRLDSVSEANKKLINKIKQEREKCMADIIEAVQGEKKVSSKKVDEYEEKLVNLNSQLALASGTITELNDAKTKTSDVLRSLQLDNKDLVNKYETDLFEAFDKVKILIDENNSMQTKLNEEREKCKVLNNNLNDKLEVLKSTILNLQKRISDQKKELLQDIDKVISERDISKSEASKYENEIREMNGKLLILEEALDECNKMKSIKSESQAKQTRKRVKQIEKQISNL